MDLDGRCDNASLAIVRAFALLDRRGRDVAVAIAKLTYQVDRSGRARLAATAVRLRDELEPGGALRFPSDAAVEKPGTDVGLVGTAHPPPRTSTSLAWLSVGPVRKVIRLVGPRLYVRAFRGVDLSPPALLGPTPLRHDLAFGGTDHAADGTLVETASNPIGRGFALDPAKLAGTPAPQLEPAEENPSAEARASACFAPVRAEWEPRRSLAGTFDDRWSTERAPVAPRDADPRAACWSGAGLWSATPLAPDVPVEVGGILPEGTWQFRLPDYALRFAATIDGVRTELPTHLDGFLVDADQQTVELTFRGVARLPRPWDRLDRLSTWGVGSMPKEAFEDPLPPSRLREGTRTPVRT